MRKFILTGTAGRHITGTYLGIQSFPIMEDDEYEKQYITILTYIDERGCIWTNRIDQGDQIEFL